MPTRLSAAAALIGLVLIAPPPAPAAESLRDLLHRQTQEMLDAVGAGSAKVWERYLDPGVRYTDESGRSRRRRGSWSRSGRCRRGCRHDPGHRLRRRGPWRRCRRDLRRRRAREVSRPPVALSVSRDRHLAQDEGRMAPDRESGPRAAKGSAGARSPGLGSRRILRDLRADPGDLLRDPMRREHATGRASGPCAGGAQGRGAGRALRGGAAEVPVRLPPRRGREDHGVRAAARGLGPRLEAALAGSRSDRFASFRFTPPTRARGSPPGISV